MQNCRAQAPLPGLTSENRNFVSSTSSRSGCADPRVAVAPQIAPVISELVRPAQAVCGKVNIEPTISADVVDDLSRPARRASRPSG